MAQATGLDADDRLEMNSHRPGGSVYGMWAPQSGRAVRWMLQATAPELLRGPFQLRALSLNRSEKHSANLPLIIFLGCLKKGAKWLSFFSPTLCVRVRRRRGWSASYGLLVMAQLPSEFFWTVISLPKASSWSKPSELHNWRLPIVKPNLFTGPPSRQIELSLCTDKITLAEGDEPPVYRHPSPTKDKKKAISTFGRGC